MRRHLHGDHGFTLIEILLAITVLGILSGVMANAIAYYNGLGRKAYQVLQRQNELQSVLDGIIDGRGERSGLLVAKSVVISGDADPCAIGDTAYKSSMEFTLPDNTVIVYKYDAADKNIRIKVGEAAEVSIAENACFSAKDAGSNIVMLRLRSTVNGTGGDRLVELVTQVKPRNVPSG